MLNRAQLIVMCVGVALMLARAVIPPQKAAWHHVPADPTAERLSFGLEGQSSDFRVLSTDNGLLVVQEGVLFIFTGAGMLAMARRRESVL